MSGFVVWMTGLSGAGKSTLASLLTQELSLLGVHVECLDGDEVRKNLSHGLGFSREDRDRNVRRIGYVARMVARSGACAITAAISPYRALRDEIRSKTENFLEVYCECPLDVLTERDPKGLYKRALAGEIKNFTGVDDPYEAPEDPEVLLRTDKMSPQECINEIISVLRKKGLLSVPMSGPTALPPPFGGEVFEAREASLGEFAAAKRAVSVTPDVAQNIQAVGSGFFSPVSGFMTEREAVKVEKSSALEGGTPWWNRPFVLPLGEAENDPGDREVVQVKAGGQPVALVRAELVWGEPGARRIAGPIEAIAPGSRRGMSARGIRGRARDEGWRHLVAVFPLTAPNDSTRKSVGVVRGVSDAVVIAARARDFPSWRSVSEGEGSNLFTVLLPDDFPTEEPRARLVVQKSVGASANLVVE